MPSIDRYGKKNTGAEVTTVSKRLVYDHNIQDLDVALSVQLVGQYFPVFRRGSRGGGGARVPWPKGPQGEYFVHKSNIKVILLIVSLLSSNI